MKYVVIGDGIEELLFMFPKGINHDDFYEIITKVKSYKGNSWERKYFDYKAISAGFVQDGYCIGRSESLNLKSRGEIDDKLMNAQDD